ncbi:hypothetical protein C8R45DRAFT_946712 [Mycena sanguinolenta]|nr:hypothetical protein C8R45DRAFT_946712 [Mycena sanguinolenta]
MPHDVCAVDVGGTHETPPRELQQALTSLQRGASWQIGGLAGRDRAGRGTELEGASRGGAESRSGVRSGIASIGGVKSEASKQSEAAPLANEAPGRSARLRNPQYEGEFQAVSAREQATEQPSRRSVIR